VPLSFTPPVRRSLPRANSGFSDRATRRAFLGFREECVHPETPGFFRTLANFREENDDQGYPVVPYPLYIPRCGMTASSYSERPCTRFFLSGMVLFPSSVTPAGRLFDERLDENRPVATVFDLPAFPSPRALRVRPLSLCPMNFSDSILPAQASASALLPSSARTASFVHLETRRRLFPRGVLFVFLKRVLFR